ncbi:MAG TPA: lysophospholipid acyltransferase family protein [Acidobacteriaceae bacterium]|jgi:1-acyl-sn-glycerol-3-phosphate acyltransferase|nr:lysophospholipid acyltransferase family protein [Acidobacteriaceae bacterium]
MFSAILLVSTWVVLALPCALIAFPWALLTGDIAFLYRTGIFVVRTGLRAAGIRPEFQQESPLDPAQRYIFLSNHISNLDPPILIPLLPGRVSVFLKRSLMRIPILGYAMKLASFIPVDRDGRAESAIESMHTATNVLRSGVHILSFVEGTRSRDGRLQSFKKGPFYLAMHSGAPVVPVSISGTEKMMRKGSLRIFPGTARVVLHPALQPHDYPSREAFMDAVRASIASGLPDWMRR